MLEPNAGFCSDRSLYTTSGILVGDNEDVTTPLATGSNITRYNFGAYRRNMSISQPPSLACPRDKADIYTISSINENSDISTYNGNGQLKKPVALLTADEASFAGSGNSAINGSSYHVQSYLYSGSWFLLLSPGIRETDGFSKIFDLSTKINLTNQNNVGGVRPVISLKHETIIASGSGTAVDPWVIQPDNNQTPEATDPLGVMEENNDSWQTLKIILLVNSSLWV